MIRRWVRGPAGTFLMTWRAPRPRGLGSLTAQTLLRALSLPRVPRERFSTLTRRRASFGPANHREPRRPIPRGRAEGGLSTDRPRRASSGVAGADVRGSRTAASRLRGTVSCCCATHVLVPCLANPSLTDAPNALYYCLPNHACVGKGCRRRPPLPSGSGSFTRDY